MEHSSSTHRYSWTINLEDYKDEWWDIAEDRAEYESAVSRFTGFFETSLGRTRTKELMDEANDSPLRYAKSHNTEDSFPNRIYTYFESDEELTEDELVEGREAFLEALGDTLADTMYAGNITGGNEEWYEAGIDYEADPESNDSIRISADPDFEGDVMELAEERRPS